ncbi:MAG: DUF4249 domain-containing protein [Bacteroidales bacterium]|nr:DUF4249 domain-containing protein [Bacteroidales bacterium]MBN2818830.1 DUF4249 domain-containing protein [Bacteroidales bacterium]
MLVNRAKKYLKGFIRPGKYILYVFFASIVFAACIEKFDPNLSDYDNLLVIQGSIIKNDSLQTVEISRSSPMKDPQIIPVTGCYVVAEDKLGNEFVYRESNKSGEYYVHIPEEYMNYNSEFRLHVVTSDKKRYVSDYDAILESSPIDSIYFEESSYQSSSEYFPNGLQFFADLKAPDENTKNYRWLLQETYEYHSPYTIGAIYAKHLDSIFSPYAAAENFPEVKIPAPLDTLTKCWVISNVKGLYSASTQNLMTNQKKKIPLNYIDETNPKLNIRYSLLVKQYALTESSYEYWNRNKVESSESGGLYQTQPSQSKSNFRNTEDPDEVVLGYFYASSYTEKRIFYDGPFHVPSYSFYHCRPDTFDVLFHDRDFVKLFDIDENPMKVLWATADDVCFNCTLYLGTNVKPEYW